jgi:hypothetical protein
VHTLPGHLSSSPFIFSGVRVVQSFVFCDKFWLSFLSFLSLSFFWPLCCLSNTTHIRSSYYKVKTGGWIYFPLMKGLQWNKYANPFTFEEFEFCISMMDMFIGILFYFPFDDFKLFSNVVPLCYIQSMEYVRQDRLPN